MYQYLVTSIKTNISIEVTNENHKLDKFDKSGILFKILLSMEFNTKTGNYFDLLL
jgi:hypothetical protein